MFHIKGRGQKYFNFALALQDERLTIFSRPANTCTRPKKVVCNKENGGGGQFDVFEVPYITAKMIFTHCIPYTDKNSFSINTLVATFFSQNHIYFPLFLQELSYVRHFSRTPI